MLRYIGRNAEADVLAALFGDQLALRNDFAGIDTGRPPEVLGVAMRYLSQARVVPRQRVPRAVAWNDL